MKFKYKAQNKGGQLQQGIVEASSTRSAKELLIQNGLSIVSLDEIKEVPLISSLLRIWEGVRPKEFVIFARQLSTLIDSKVPLLSALHSIANQTENKYFALKINSVIVDIDGGSSLSEAMAKNPETFTQFYVNMVKAGEASGTLQKALNDLADNTEKNYELTAKLRGAMYYPGFILGAMIVVGFVVMAFVMPKLLVILKESNVELPLQTKLLIAISDFMANYWWAVGIAMIFGISGVMYYIKTDEGKKEFDQLILKIPIIKKILHNVYIARFSENLSTLIQSGLPITTALLITSDVVGNHVYKEIIRESAEEIKKGGGIADVLNKYEIIPPVVVQMVRVGEHTGRIEFTLSRVTKFYLAETDRMVKNFSTLIEPILMVILAVGVGLLVSAVLLPIYQVATSIT
ncbi:type II secretion system F family protein [bacterium]|jgi:type IV pilus assembly protein PilC|nr:type II secretion system F family protein [bacterium]MBT4250739.1 type II secretion system F family protein [bacterium]MBT4598178.1 type II secretion system F family protein [bacterium]MBT6753776.1 type II secretion system F family protein [bacterium]MBT7037511.1 type II secretion system F family protein [bacterium]